MFEKDLGVAVLLDHYRALLTPRQCDVLDLYYNDDLSLAEIAENLGISRQGVRHSVKRGEDELRAYEAALGLARRAVRIEAVARELSGRLAALRETAEPSVRPELDALAALAAAISEETP